MERFVEKGGADHASPDLPAVTRAQQMKKSQMDRINLASKRNPAEHFSIMTDYT